MMNLRLSSCCRRAVAANTGAALRVRSGARSLPRRYKSASTADKKMVSAATARSAEETTTTTSAPVPIATSLLAAVLGIGTVSAAAAVVESMTAVSVPTFDPKGQRYDQSHFLGRFSRMLLACDPRLLLYTEKQVRQAQGFLQQHGENDYHSYDGASMDRALWEAKRIVDAAVHPDTGDVIPRPFRMSGYVPYNGPICVAMVASQSTLPLLFWSWVNQSQNALVNYYNRNAASPMTNETLMKSYAAAVGSALAVAFGLATFIQKRYPPAQARAMLRWVSFPSAVVASSLNCYIVRSPEITTGVPLQNAAGDVVLPGATSCIAAKRGVESTTASRAMLQAPVYFLPPLLVSSGWFRTYLQRAPHMTVPITTYCLLVCFGVGLPATVAVFPQMSAIAATDVEERFQHLRDPHTQQPYQVFYYNKGL